MNKGKLQSQCGCGEPFYVYYSNYEYNNDAREGKVSITVFLFIRELVSYVVYKLW